MSIRKFLPILALPLLLIKPCFAEDEDARNATKWVLVSTSSYLAGGLSQLNIPQDSYEACEHAKEKMIRDYTRMGPNFQYVVTCVPMDWTSTRRR